MGAIPKIKPPPQSPRRSRPASTHSLNPDFDFISFDTEASGIRRCSQSLRVTSRAAATALQARKKPGEKIPPSTSLILPKPEDSSKISSPSFYDKKTWEEYVQAAFPQIEDKVDVIKLEKEDTTSKTEQVTKVRHYAKLETLNSVDETKPPEVKTNEERGCEPLLSEKRKKLFLRKHIHSAPDTPDPTIRDASPPPPRSKRCAPSFCMGGRCNGRGSDGFIRPPQINLENELGIEHIDDLVYPGGSTPCHFCKQFINQAIHDDNRLKIVSGGLLQKRDGSKSSQYMNLPSPILQCEEDTQVSLQQNFDYKNQGDETPASEEDDTFPDGEQPPPSAFVRRKALASSNLPDEARADQLAVDDYNRRSSTVVLPHMAICPGDLMVYSKALINAQLVSKKKQEKIDSSDTCRRGNWSIFKLFERHKKAGNIAGLEQFLDNYKSEPFNDFYLSRYRGITWAEFHETVAQNKKKQKRAKKRHSKSSAHDTASDNESDSSSSSKTNSSDQGQPDVGGPSNSQQEIPEPSPKKVERPRFGSRGSMSCLKTTFEESENIQPAKERTAEFSSVKSEIPKRSILSRAQTSSLFSQSALNEAETIKDARRSTPPKMLARSESSKNMNPKNPRASPKLTRQFSDLFKKKTSVEKVWLDKGKAERQESAMTRFQKKLIRTQSERAIGLSRLSSWKHKAKQFAELENPTLISPVSTVSHGEYKRREAVWDMYQNECIFHFDHLATMKKAFLDPLKSVQVEGFLMFVEPKLIFINLEELCDVTINFCHSFIRLLTKEVGPSGELNTVRILRDLFKLHGKKKTAAFHNYALNYIQALDYLESCRAYEAFNVFEKWCMKNKRTRRLHFADFLVAPVQHIMKTPLLLKEILAKTEDPEEAAIIKEILQKEEESIRALDDKMHWLKNYEHLLDLAKNIEWPSVMEIEPKLYIPEYLKKSISKQVCDRIILSPRRKILKEGILMCWDTGKPIEMIVLLFDDMLLLAKKKKQPKRRKQTSNILTTPCPSGTVYKQPLSLDRISICDPQHRDAKPENSFATVVVNRFQEVIYVHTLQAKSSQEREEWVTAMRNAQENFKKNIQSSLFRDRSPPPPGVNPEATEPKLKDTEKAVHTQDESGLNLIGGGVKTESSVTTERSSRGDLGGTEEDLQSSIQWLQRKRTMSL